MGLWVTHVVAVVVGIDANVIVRNYLGNVICVNVVANSVAVNARTVIAHVIVSAKHAILKINNYLIERKQYLPLCCNLLRLLRNPKLIEKRVEFKNVLCRMILCTTNHQKCNILYILSHLRLTSKDQSDINIKFIKLHNLK